MEELPLLTEEKDGLGYEVVAMEDEEKLEVMLRLKAPDPPLEEAGPYQVQVVLDTSESMNPRKLFPALRGVDYLASHLREDDRIGIVTFGGGADLALPAERVEDGEGVREALRELRPFGVADPVAGLLMGLKELRRSTIPGRGAIYLVTDGALLRGDEAVSHQLAGLAASAREAGFPVTVIAMDGKGSGYLSAIAHKGGGRMAGMSDGARVCEVMLEQIPGRRKDRIRGLEVVVEGSEAVRSVQMLGSDEPEPYGDGVLCEVGDLRDGQTRDVLIELEVEGLEQTGDDPIAALDLKWSDLGLEKAFWASMPVKGNGCHEEGVLFEFPKVEVKLRRPSRVLGRAEEDGEGADEEAGPVRRPWPGRRPAA